MEEELFRSSGKGRGAHGQTLGVPQNRSDFTLPAGGGAKNFLNISQKEMIR